MKSKLMLVLAAWLVTNNTLCSETPDEQSALRGKIAGELRLIESVVGDSFARMERTLECCLLDEPSDGTAGASSVARFQFDVPAIGAREVRQQIRVILVLKHQADKIVRVGVIMPAYPEKLFALEGASIVEKDSDPVIRLRYLLSDTETFRRHLEGLVHLKHGKEPAPR